MRTDVLNMYVRVWMQYMDSRGTNSTRCGNASDNTFIDICSTLYRFLGYRGAQTKYFISDVRYGLHDSMRSTQVKKHDVVSVFTLWLSSTIEREWRVATSASCNAVSTAPTWATPQHTPPDKRNCAPAINLSVTEKGTNVEHRRKSTAHKLFGGMPSNNRSVATPTSQPICPRRHPQRKDATTMSDSDAAQTNEREHGFR